MNTVLFYGDCLSVMDNIEDGSVDCVLCDLPYGSLKSVIADGWKQNNTNIKWDSLINIEKLFSIYSRILRQNGSIILFNKEPLTTSIRTCNNKDIEYAFSYVWKKSNFSNPYISNVAPLSVTENIDVFYKKYDDSSYNKYNDYRHKIFEQIGADRKEIISRCGQSVDHFFRNRTKQFITQEGYNKLIEVYKIDKFNSFITFDELNKIICKCKRTFNVPKGRKYITDFLEFSKDSVNIHPTQKPVALLEFLLDVHTNELDTVLDNCMGSGSTGIACINRNRNFIGIEKDEHYFNLASKRIKDAESKLKMKLF